MSKLKVCLTSHPARIQYVLRVLKSLVNQDVDANEYDIVLTLAKTQFPQGIPCDLQTYIDEHDNIELLWHDTDIKSHKKLIPVMTRYRDCDILVTDDDVRRPTNWVRMFIDDHARYPHDIICGNFCSSLRENMTWHAMYGESGERVGKMNRVCGMTFEFARPANGLGGVLYPAHTFDDDARFFDEALMMQLCETSDELWQFCFATMYDKTFRQTTHFIDGSAMMIVRAQIDCSLYSINKYKYNDMTRALFETFPLFEQKLTHNMNHVTCVMHLTQTTNAQCVIESILNQTHVFDKLIITIYSKDIIDEKLSTYINAHDNIELIETHDASALYNKYVYAQNACERGAIASFDENVIHNKRALTRMMRAYVETPNRAIRCDGSSLLLPPHVLNDCENAHDIETLLTNHNLHIHNIEKTNGYARH